MGIFDITSRRSPLMKRRSQILDRVAIIIKFDSINRVMMAKKSAKKCVARSEFLFCLFSRFHQDCGCAELASNFITQTILDMRRFGPKNRRLMENAPQNLRPQVPIQRLKVRKQKLIREESILQAFLRRASQKLTLPLRMVSTGSQSCPFFLLRNFKFKVIDYISQISRKWVNLQK